MRGLLHENTILSERSRDANTGELGSSFIPFSYWRRAGTGQVNYSVNLSLVKTSGSISGIFCRRLSRFMFFCTKWIVSGRLVLKYRSMRGCASRIFSARELMPYMFTWNQEYIADWKEFQNMPFYRLKFDVSFGQLGSMCRRIFFYLLSE